MNAPTRTPARRKSPATPIADQSIRRAREAAVAAYDAMAARRPLRPPCKLQPVTAACVTPGAVEARKLRASEPQAWVRGPRT